MNNISRNDKCYCGSNKKYKNCCIIVDENNRLKEMEKYSLGHPISSENLQLCYNLFSEKYDDHKIIDISNDITIETYKKYHIKNYNSKIIMLVEKNDKNSKVFESRIENEDSNIMVMYRGAFKTFNILNLLNVEASLDDMIQKRLAGLSGVIKYKIH
jgi:hypothetical protein